MMRSTTHLPARRLLAAAALCLLVPAAPAAAATVTTPSPPAGGASAVVVKAKPGARPAVARAPRGVVVLGGPSVVAAVRPPAAKGGAVKVRFRGSAKVVAKATSLLGGATLPAGACSSKGLTKVLTRGALPAADAKALGAALQRRACGGATAADTAVLRRLGLKVPADNPMPQSGASTPLPGPTPSAGSTPRPSGGTSTPPPASGTPGAGGPSDPGTFGACRNGKDDDGDGQTDARGQGANPDPGCMNENDTTETGEKPASAACAAVSGVSMTPGNPTTSAFAAVNRDCGISAEVWVVVQPGVQSCEVFTAEQGYVCVIEKLGVAHAYQFLAAGKITDIYDMPLTLTGPADCSKPATIVLERPDLSVEEIVEPIQGCTGGGTPPKAQCANGVDDDGDGQVDARQQPAATDPDPGCSGTADTTENSEIAPPGGCDVGIGTFGGDPRKPGFIASGCGSLTGAWFRAPNAPASCAYLLGGATEGTCTASGELGVATFAATTGELRMVTPLGADAQCRNITVALERADGQAIEVREPWC